MATYNANLYTPKWAQIYQQGDSLTEEILHYYKTLGLLYTELADIIHNRGLALQLLLITVGSYITDIITK